MKPHPSRIVDFHVHLFPDKGFDAVWNFFASSGTDVVYKFYSGECVKYLNERGVSPIVFSNYAHKQGIAEPMNEWNIALLDQFPDLYCFAAYHPDDGNALEYAERMIAHPRVVGVKMHFHVQRLYPHDTRLFPLYEMIREKGKRLLLHVGNGPRTNQFVGMGHFRKVLDRFPDLPATVPHMGGLEFAECMGLLDDHPGIYLDTAYSFWPGLPFTFNLGPEYLERYRDRILYGSDFPNMILPREREIDYLLGLDLSDDFYDNVFYANGMRLLDETCPAAR